MDWVRRDGFTGLVFFRSANDYAYRVEEGLPLGKSVEAILITETVSNTDDGKFF